jgi:MraZ protein
VSSFRGGPVLKLDDKGRVTVPSKFSSVLVATVQGQLVMRRLYVGSATDVEIDSGSRVLIPPELRKWAGLDRDVKFMGVGAYFELWDSARYEAREAAMLAGPSGPSSCATWSSGDPPAAWSAHHRVAHRSRRGPGDAPGRHLRGRHLRPRRPQPRVLARWRPPAG